MTISKPTTNPAPYAHLTKTHEMPERIAATLVGIPKICHVRLCRREDRCLGRGVVCMHKHGDRIMATLAREAGLMADYDAIPVED